MKIERLLREIRRDELIKLTQDLIRIPSVKKEGGNEEKVAHFISHLLEEMGDSMWWSRKWNLVLRTSSLCFRAKVTVPA